MDRATSLAGSHFVQGTIDGVIVANRNTSGACAEADQGAAGVPPARCVSGAHPPQRTQVPTVCTRTV